MYVYVARLTPARTRRSTEREVWINHGPKQRLASCSSRHRDLRGAKPSARDAV